MAFKPSTGKKPSASQVSTSSEPETLTTAPLCSSIATTAASISLPCSRRSSCGAREGAAVT